MTSCALHAMSQFTVLLLACVPEDNSPVCERSPVSGLGIRKLSEIAGALQEPNREQDKGEQPDHAYIYTYE